MRSGVFVIVSPGEKIGDQTDEKRQHQTQSQIDAGFRIIYFSPGAERDFSRQKNKLADVIGLTAGFQLHQAVAFVQFFNLVRMGVFLRQAANQTGRAQKAQQRDECAVLPVEALL